MAGRVKPIFLLGDNWTANDAKLQAGFVSTGGIELLRMLEEARLLELTAEDTDRLRKFYNDGDPTNLDMIWRMHPTFHRSNVFQLHPPNNDLAALCGSRSEGIPGYPALLPGAGGYIRAEFQPHLERLADELIDIDPNVVVCLGNCALWALTGDKGITKLRGTTLVSTRLATGFKLLPTYHPASILRQYENRHVTIADLIKVGREAAYPEIRRPRRMIWIEPTIDDLETFYANEIANCPLLSVDIETAGTAITEIGFASSPTTSIVIPFFDRRAKNRSYWADPADERKAWAIVRRILEDATIPKLFQNGLYDIAFIIRTTGIRIRGAQEDTMLLHHSLQPESLKGLGFLGSLYCDEGAWKQMRKRKVTIKKDD